MLFIKGAKILSTRLYEFFEGGDIDPIATLPDKLVWRSGDRVYAPTLEELIEACGENFGSLDKQHDGWLASANFGQTCFAKTPVEAVAHLWLALQKR